MLPREKQNIAPLVPTTTARQRLWVAEPPRRLLSLFDAPNRPPGAAGTARLPPSSRGASESTSSASSAAADATLADKMADRMARGARSEARSLDAGALSPTAVARLFKDQLDGLGDLAILGEVSGFRGAAGAHWYFDLKDAEARIAVSFFTHANRRHRGELPQNGDLVVVRGRPSFYGPQGRAQVIASSLQAAGAGALEQALAERRARLAAEGLFAENRKRPLPRLPSCIGVVTSLQTAALRDVLQVIASRAPKMSVLISPSLVQGPVADVGASLAMAIERLAASGRCDVILVVRGGGSREDLRAFDEENVVRAIVKSSVPVVSGVGHEIDVTLCDHAADKRAATPSQAAEFAVPAVVDVDAQVAALAQRLRASLQRSTALQEQRLQSLVGRLPAPATLAQRHGRMVDVLASRLARRSPLARVHEDGQTLDALERRLLQRTPSLASAEAQLAQLSARLVDAVARRMVDADGRLVRAMDQLEALSPLAVLKRGWALATIDGRIARAKDLVPGTRLRLRVEDGDADVVVDLVRSPERR